MPFLSLKQIHVPATPLTSSFPNLIHSILNDKHFHAIANINRGVRAKNGLSVYK